MKAGSFIGKAGSRIIESDFYKYVKNLLQAGSAAGLPFVGAVASGMDYAENLNDWFKKFKQSDTQGRIDMFYKQPMKKKNNGTIAEDISLTELPSTTLQKQPEPEFNMNQTSYMKFSSAFD